MIPSSRLGLILRNVEFRGVILLGVVLGLAYSFVGPFMSLFGTEEVGMSPLAFGVFMTATSVCSIALGTVLSRWSDVKWSRRSVLLIGAGGASVGYIGYAFLRDLPGLLFVGCVFLGLAAGTFSQLFAYARDVVEHDADLKPEAPLYMNIVRLSFAFAWTVGPMLSAWWMEAWGFRGVFLLAAALYLVFGVLVLWTVPARPPRAETLTRALALPLSVALHHRVVVTYFVAFCLYQACMTMGMMNLPLYLTRTLHAPMSSVGIAYSIAPVFELPLMLYVGALALRLNHAFIIRAALFLAVAYYFGLSVAPGPYAVYGLQILSAAIVAVMSGLAITFFQDFMPGQPGTATNIYANSMRVGGTGGYLAFGVIASKFGHGAVFIVCGVACLLSLLLLLSVRGARVDFEEVSVGASKAGAHA
jgi:SET family sugar efflux transporter-like MFS transporter